MKKLFFVLFLFGCTERSRVRAWGGSEKVCVPAGEKLLNLEWDRGGSLWVTSRPMREGEIPETIFFREHSKFGMEEGMVTVLEHPLGTACSEK